MARASSEKVATSLAPARLASSCGPSRRGFAMSLGGSSVEARSAQVLEATRSVRRPAAVAAAAAALSAFSAEWARSHLRGVTRMSRARNGKQRT